MKKREIFPTRGAGTFGYDMQKCKPQHIPCTV